MARIPRVVAVVDDDPYVCKAFERLLRSAGISVKTFASGTKFLQAVRDYKPDCVVVDLHMPGIDGFEVLMSPGARSCCAAGHRHDRSRHA